MSCLDSREGVESLIFKLKNTSGILRTYILLGSIGLVTEL